VLRANLISLLLILYSGLITALLPFLKLAARFSPKLKSQLTDRPGVAETAALLQERRKRFRQAAVFFCSSAGEFEQARPLIDRLTARGDTFVHALIFSRSGIDYAKARGEQCSYSLAPATDSVWHWGWIFSAVRPTLVTVVRHELWPGFIEAATHYAPVFLIDASASQGEQKSGLKKLIRANLLRMFERIFVVSAGDGEFFRSQYGIGKDHLKVVGDTKYDRVLERAQNAAAAKSPAGLFSPGSTGRLILGSAHKADLDVFVAAVQKEPAIMAEWQVVIAPHHIDAENIELFRSMLAGLGVGVALYSRGDAPACSGDQPQILLLDTMGMLAEAYSSATAAFVGGASHYQVHNVLEAAVHGLALAWGPQYKNSQEAVYLAGQNAAHVICNEEDFRAWLTAAKNTGAASDNNTAVAVRSLCGASDLIFEEWKALLNG
jgi:3-deoxy-D-manno-octulosonic-acid transferase